MYLMAKGIDKSDVEERVGVKSISHETTFEEDTTDSTVIYQALDAICEDVFKEAVNQHLLFKTVTVKIRYQGFETHTRSKTLPFLTNRQRDLQKTANELLFTNLRKDCKVRLIGVQGFQFDFWRETEDSGLEFSDFLGHQTFAKLFFAGNFSESFSGSHDV